MPNACQNSKRKQQQIDYQTYIKKEEIYNNRADLSILKK